LASKRIGEILLEKGMITAEELSHALEVQKERGGLLGVILVELGYLKPKELSDFLESQKK